MKTKTIFLWMLLAILVGGVNSAWATDYVLKGSTRSSYAASQTTATYSTGGVTITVTNTNSNKYDKYSGSGLDDYIKTSANVVHTVDISSISSGEKVTSIAFSGFNNTDNKDGNTYTSYISNVNGTSYSEQAGSNQFLSRTLVTAANDEDIKTFTVSGLSIVCGEGALFSFTVGSRETDLIITITTEERTIDEIYSGSYPYTWDFSVETAKWTKSISQMQASTGNWSINSTEGQARPTMNLSSIQINDIDIVKGLSFTTDNAVNLCLDWKNRHLWMNGTLIIPNLAVGQTITFDSNNDVTGDATVGRTTGKVFTVTTAGNASFTVNTYVRSIAVTKSDLTGFSLNTSDVYKYDNANYNSESTNKTAINSLSFDYDATSPYLRLKLNMDQNIVVGDVASNTSNYFTITNSSNSEVIDITDPGTSAGRNVDNRVYLYGIHVLKPGTSTLTFNFAGTDAVNAATCTGTITVNKLNQNISYATTEISKSYENTADDPFINPLTETTVGTGITIAYTSSDTHVATVGADGTVTILNAGTTVITATAPGNDYYNEATASYTLTVNGDRTPTMSWVQSLEGETYTLTYGNTYTRTATQTYGGNGTAFTVLYKSSDESKATVSDKGVVTSLTGVGTVTITAYVPGYGRYNPTEISYTVNLAKAEFAFVFRPTSATVNAGCTITPDTNFPTILLSNISSLTISSSNSSVATVPADMLDASHTYLYYNAATDQIQGLKPLISIPSGASSGSTATITMTFTSDKYVTTGGNVATFTVTVADVSTRNFSWSDGASASYTLCEGDFMYLPEITGNSNGNHSLSNGTTNASTGSSTGKAYVYEIKNGTVTWNNKDYKLGQGVPDIQVLNTDGTATTGAYVFWITGQGGYTSPDRLMIYGKTAGTYKIRAVDPQLTSLYCDATLIVTAKSTLTTAVSDYKKTMSFPYTWDFTKPVGTTLLNDANSLYWEKDGSSYTMKVALSFNYDYADEDGDGKTDKNNEDTYKIFSDGNGNLIPEFYGMTIALGNSTQGSWYSKVDKIKINGSSPYLSFSGGPHYLQLPNNPGVTEEHPTSDEPSNYKLYMKLRGNGSKARILLSGGVAENMTVKTLDGTLLTSSGKDYEHPEASGVMGTVIVSYDVAKGEAIKVGLNGIDVYWIAFSTEEKIVRKPSMTTYPASTYCYPKALDLDKSAEANDITSYYASGFSSGGSVIMTSISGRVEANTGLMLKLPSSTTPTPASCYMIVDAKNTSSYSAPTSGLTEGATNYLIHISSSGTVPRFVYDEDDVSKINYTNFILTNKYFDVNENFEQVGNANYRDWCFVRSHNASVSANMAYLRVNNRSGGIMSASRLMEEQTSENVDPASREMLGIVFEDDQNTTEIKSLSRDSNVVDDGWYTLHGIRVTAPLKAGLYIYKGKKVIVK